MPSAKPRYDLDGDWKCKQFTDDEWEELKENIRKKLRPFYPPDTIEDADNGTFQHPADAWANFVLSEAESAISTMLATQLRLTNEELRAEHKHVLATLKKAQKSLETMSQDLRNLIDVDADELECLDKIMQIIPFIESAGPRISQLLPAKKRIHANHEAVTQMVISVLRIFKGEGMPLTATAETNNGYVSNAVKILKIVGDALGVVLDEKTWKKKIDRAKKLAPDLQANSQT